MCSAAGLSFSGTGPMNQCNLNQVKALFPGACSMLSLGASPRAEMSFLYWLAVVRVSHLGRVWMAFAYRLFSCMKNAWIFPQVLINAIFKYWELQAKKSVFSDYIQMCSLHLIIWTHSLGMSGRQTYPSFYIPVTTLYLCKRENVGIFFFSFP